MGGNRGSNLASNVRSVFSERDRRFEWQKPLI